MIAHACVMETREPGEGFALINDWSARSWSLVDLRQTKLSPEDLRGKVLSNPKLAGSPYAPTLAIFSLLLAIAATALGLCGGHIGGSSFLSAAGGVISTASQWAIWACVPLLAMSGVLAIFSMRRVRRLRELADDQWKFITIEDDDVELFETRPNLVAKMFERQKELRKWDETVSTLDSRVAEGRSILETLDTDSPIRSDVEKSLAEDEADLAVAQTRRGEIQDEAIAEVDEAKDESAWERPIEDLKASQSAALDWLGKRERGFVVD